MLGPYFFTDFYSAYIARVFYNLLQRKPPVWRVVVDCFSSYPVSAVFAKIDGIRWWSPWFYCSGSAEDFNGWSGLKRIGYRPVSPQFPAEVFKRIRIEKRIVRNGKHSPCFWCYYNSYSGSGRKRSYGFFQNFLGYVLNGFVYCKYNILSAIIRNISFSWNESITKSIF